MYLTQKEGLKGLFSPICLIRNFILPRRTGMWTIRVSAQGIRTINKNGLKATLEDAVKKGFLKSY